MQHHYNATPLQYNTFTIQLHYKTTALRYNTITIQHHYDTTPLWYNTTTIQHHYNTTPLQYNINTIQYDRYLMHKEHAPELSFWMALAISLLSSSNPMMSRVGPTSITSGFSRVKDTLVDGSPTAVLLRLRFMRFLYSTSDICQQKEKHKRNRLKSG